MPSRRWQRLTRSSRGDVGMAAATGSPSGTVGHQSALPSVRLAHRSGRAVDGCRLSALAATVSGLRRAADPGGRAVPLVRRNALGSCAVAHNESAGTVALAANAGGSALGPLSLPGLQLCLRQVGPTHRSGYSVWLTGCVPSVTILSPGRSHPSDASRSTTPANRPAVRICL
jgi:hypothetical protein